MNGCEIPSNWAVELFYDAIELIDTHTLATLGDIGGVLGLLLFCRKAVKRSVSAKKSAGAKAKTAGIVLMDYDLGEKMAVWVSAKMPKGPEIGKTTITSASIDPSVAASVNATSSIGF